jgi:uroporphyrinogen decarboxylase
VDVLPRGELFISQDFLNHFFSKYKGEYIKQLEAAAQCLGLSVVGIELDAEWSRPLLIEKAYKKLEEYFTVGCINGPVARFIENDGFFDAMLNIKNNPSLFSYRSAEVLRDTEEKVRLAHANGLRAIAIADDIAGNKGLLFAFTYFIDVVWPVYKKIAEIIKENALFAFFHSDGETRRVIDPLIRAGYDCIHPVDTQAGLNLYDLKKEFGESISFMGHIDMITWSKEQIHKEISLAENEFKKGGLILGSTCGISMKTVNDRLVVLYPRWEKE